MTSRATPEAVRAIMRRQHVLNSREKLNILTFALMKDMNSNYVKLDIIFMQ